MIADQAQLYSPGIDQGTDKVDRTAAGELLSIRDAYKLAQERGYPKSESTFRRDLEKGVLERYGFEPAAPKPPKGDNRSGWIRDTWQHQE